MVRAVLRYSRQSRGDRNHRTGRAHLKSILRRYALIRCTRREPHGTRLQMPTTALSVRTHPKGAFGDGSIGFSKTIHAKDATDLWQKLPAISSVSNALAIAPPGMCSPYGSCLVNPGSSYTLQIVSTTLHFSRQIRQIVAVLPLLATGQHREAPEPVMVQSWRTLLDPHRRWTISNRAVVARRSVLVVERTGNTDRDECRCSVSCVVQSTA